MIHERHIDISARVDTDGNFLGALAVVMMHLPEHTGETVHVRGTMRVSDAGDPTTTRAYLIDQIFVFDGTSVTGDDTDNVSIPTGSPTAATLSIGAGIVGSSTTISLCLIAPNPGETPLSYDVTAKLQSTVIR